jgi:hypothetical protein
MVSARSARIGPKLKVLRSKTPPARIQALEAERAHMAEGQRARHDILKEPAVVADHEQRPGKRRQRGLDEFERLDVEVVRRLVQDQHVRRAGRQPGDAPISSIKADRSSWSTTHWLVPH